MMGRIEKQFRRLRRYLSRSVWLARLLCLPVSKVLATRPGLIMIQIDGLSQPQFEHALAHKKLPFLQRLIHREHYMIHAHYSGLPSTTPAVQAELFYGVKGAVPAFSFRDHETRQVVRMFEPDVAAHIEGLHTKHANEALLKDGSAYADIFTGGAAEPHFCPSAMGWGSTLRAANPIALLAFLLSNPYTCLRVAGLLILELGLAGVDFLRGFVDGHNFAREVKFIPARVAISALLRELCVIGGKMDISRGLPIIHINFLGYDEQSHRRGPGSRFAHWTLKGIDNAIARLWRAANHVAWRSYEVWIYSDHGQVLVRSFEQIQGYGIEKAVAAVFEELDGKSIISRYQGVDSIKNHRARFLGGKHIQRLERTFGNHGAGNERQPPLVVAMGPVGHVYSPRPLQSDERAFVAHELTYKHKVPVVLTVTAPGQLCAQTEAGTFCLPEDRAQVFGAEHPFLDTIGEDLLHLCEHPDAGEFVLLGWCTGIPPMSFAPENGAHAGAAPEETNGFALLPADTPLPKREAVYLRPSDLRDAALHHLERPTRQAFEPPARAVVTETDTLRVMTYNVHSCIGMDGNLSAERIARVIARAKPDVVALQELDVGKARSHGMHQAQLIARCLAMEFQFHPALHLEEERYGDAILTHLPHRLIKAGPLPGLAGKSHLEPRGALWIAVDLHGKEIQIINTHLGLNRRERIAQAEALLGSSWMAHAQCREPVILCGDFNALPLSSTYRRLCSRLKDVQIEAQNHHPQRTYSGRIPLLRIDHIFISTGLEVTGIQVPRSELARLASDHLPLVAEVRIQTLPR